MHSNCSIDRACTAITPNNLDTTNKLGTHILQLKMPQVSTEQLRAHTLFIATYYNSNRYCQLHTCSSFRKPITATDTGNVFWLAMICTAIFSRHPINRFGASSVNGKLINRNAKWSSAAAASTMKMSFTFWSTRSSLLLLRFIHTMTAKHVLLVRDRVSLLLFTISCIRACRERITLPESNSFYHITFIDRHLERNVEYTFLGLTMNKTACCLQ